MPIAITFFVGVLLFSLAISSIGLWLGCKVGGVENGTFRRCLVLAFVWHVISVAMNIGFLYLYVREPIPEVGMLAGAVGLILPFVFIGMTLHQRLGKTLLAGLIWTGANVGFAITLYFVVPQFCPAYVFPTGSMAETLLGDHKDVTCPQCGWTFAVNASEEAEHGMAVSKSTCPNCRYDIDFDRENMKPPLIGGDRIWTLRYGKGDPERQDLMVFVFPMREKDGTLYIKRLAGLPGETMGIYYGDLYAARGLLRPANGPAEQLRVPDFLSQDADADQLKRDALTAGEGDKKFQIVRKKPEHILALRRLVYDNDFQARDLTGKAPRWAAAKDAAGWQGEPADQPRTFRHAADAAGLGWLRYRHLPRTNEPQLITDFLGYNTGRSFDDRNGSNWIGDLILECQLNIEQASGELRLELARGVDRFQAQFQLNNGTCTLVRITGGAEQELASRPTPLKGPGAFRLRFANVDRRLTVWVDKDLPFGEGVDYDAPRAVGPTADDLEPAGIGVAGGVSVSNLQLWRDVYYSGVVHDASDARLPRDAWGDPTRWQPLLDLPARTWAVHPGHYFFLGDNSAASSDSRDWGLVPERLLRGKVVMIYFPWDRFGPIR